MVRPPDRLPFSFYHGRQLIRMPKPPSASIILLPPKRNIQVIPLRSDRFGRPALHERILHYHVQRPGMREWHC